MTNQMGNSYVIDCNEDEALWAEKYRPSRVEDVILPANLKNIFQGYVDKGFIPNLLLSGGPGCGKTTVAIAMCEELGVDYYFINGSLNGGIDTLRVDIQGYASSMSMNGKRKYVILDEADYLSHATQPALRSFMEEFSKTTGFILTCNTPTKILPALRSRCTVIDFSNFVDGDKLAKHFYKRVCSILDNEKVTYDKKVVAELIGSYYPDWRKCLNQLQGYANKEGEIDSGILTSSNKEADIRELMDLMAKQDFNAVRKWSAENGSMNIADVFRMMYDVCDDYMKPSGIAQMLVTMREHEFAAAFVSNQEINMAAAFINIMSECAFK